MTSREGTNSKKESIGLGQLHRRNDRNARLRRGLNKSQDFRGEGLGHLEQLCLHTVNRISAFLQSLSELDQITPKNEISAQIQARGKTKKLQGRDEMRLNDELCVHGHRENSRQRRSWAFWCRWPANDAAERRPPFYSQRRISQRGWLHAKRTWTT